MEWAFDGVMEDVDRSIGLNLLEILVREDTNFDKVNDRIDKNSFSAIVRE